jgi:8-hydroxy-5-deazaflavin:NADPH oxidoreductase
MATSYLPDFVGRAVSRRESHRQGRSTEEVLMRISVLGTGIVGRTIGGALVSAGHRVYMGSRSDANPEAVRWARENGPGGTQGTFADSAAAAELLFNCTAGEHSIRALELAGKENLAGKALIDVANHLDYSMGAPPVLSVCNTDSLAERIQRHFPELRVVKALNTMNCKVMVDPGRVPGEHHVFLSGNHPGAKAEVAELLRQAFGWSQSNILDLGDITTARGTEMLLPVWLRLWAKLGTADFNFHIAGAQTRSAVHDPLASPTVQPMAG